MRSFLLLLKLRLKERLGVKPWRTVLLGLLFAAAGVGVSTWISLKLAAAGFVEMLPILGYVVGSAVCFVLTVLRMNDSFSGRQDTNFLLSLPVSVFGHVLTLFLTLYLYALGYLLVLTAPMGVVYGVVTEASPSFWMLWSFGLLLTGLPAVGVAALVGAFLALVLATSRKRNLLQSLLSLFMLAAMTVMLLVLVDRVGQTIVRGTALDSGSLCREIVSQITANYTFGRFYQLSVVEQNMPWLFLFIPVSIGWNIFFVFFLTMGYQIMMLSLESPVEYRNYEWQPLTALPQEQTLLRREMEAWLHSKAYLLRSTAVHVMAVLVGGYLAIRGGKETLAAFGISSLYSRLAWSLPLFLCVLVGAAVISYSGYAADGRTHWILETIPVDRKVLHRCKRNANLFIHAPFLGLEALLYFVAFPESPILLPVCLAAAWGYLWLVSVYGLWVGRRYAVYTGQSEQEILRQRGIFVRGFLPQVLVPLVLMGCFWMIA